MLKWNMGQKKTGGSGVNGASWSNGQVEPKGLFPCCMTLWHQWKSPSVSWGTKHIQMNDLKTKMLALLTRSGSIYRERKNLTGRWPISKTGNWGRESTWVLLQRIWIMEKPKGMYLVGWRPRLSKWSNDQRGWIMCRWPVWRRCK